MAAELADITPEPRYDLSDREIDRLTRSYLRGVDHDGGRFVCVKVGPDDLLANVGRTLEARSFGASFENSPQQMQEEYGPYDDVRFFFVVMDTKKGRPAGVLSCIPDSPAGFKSLNDLSDITRHSDSPITPSRVQWQHGFLPKRTWDVLTLAVPEQYRGSLSGYEASLLLYRSLYLSALENNIQRLVAIVDRGAKRGVDTLGIPFEPIGGSGAFPYLGSGTSYAVIGNVDAFKHAVDARYSKLSASSGYSIETEEAARSTRQHVIAMPLGSVAASLFGRLRHSNHRESNGDVSRSLRRQVIDAQVARATGRLATGRLGLDAQIHSSVRS